MNTQIFSDEFGKVEKIFDAARKILIVAHSRPDGDTIGSSFALRNYFLEVLKKEAVVVCEDPLPEAISNYFDISSFLPSGIDPGEFDLLLGCDAVERSFEKIVKEKKPHQKVVVFDHHLTLRLSKVKPDLVIADPKFSSVCEIIYDFFDFHRIEIGKKNASLLLLGILNDTGIFQHANTSARTMEIAADLMRKGAPLPEIIRSSFKEKDLETLRLWGRALDRAEINEKTGAIVSYLTKKDLEELGKNNEDVSMIAEMLNTVTGTKFSLVLAERDDNRIKGSLRSEDYKNVDVEKIARTLRGGGHRLASGFEVIGKLVKREEGIKVE